MRELACLTLTQETFKNEWEGAVRTLSAAGFATASMKWYVHYEKHVNITGGYVKKLKINISSILFVKKLTYL
jgi:hypothetical protein